MNSTWTWAKPGLDRTGQVAFWDRQSATYESADMTVDNSGELESVIAHVKNRSYDEIVTLGGAVGCRDPKAILEQCYCGRIDGKCQANGALPRIFFSDLSPAQVQRAERDILASCVACGAEISFHPAPIADACKSVVPAPRTLLLGIYSASGFFSADVEHGYPMAGFDEYLKNRAVLGDRFWFDHLVFKEGQLRTDSAKLCVSADASESERAAAKRQLHESWNAVNEPVGIALEPRTVVALQVVGAHEGQDGFFLSHWYNPEAIIGLLQTVFPRGKYEIERVTFPKGMLLSIGRVGGESTGVVTVLNNVLGNILPEEQIPALEAIRAIMQ